MCNLYSLTKGQDAIRRLFDGIDDRAGNLPELPAIFPDSMAPNRPEGGGGRSRTGDGALGHAVAALRHEGSQDRSRGDQYP